MRWVSRTRSNSPSTRRQEILCVGVSPLCTCSIDISVRLFLDDSSVFQEERVQRSSFARRVCVAARSLFGERRLCWHLGLFYCTTVLLLGWCGCYCNISDSSLASTSELWRIQRETSEAGSSRRNDDEIGISKDESWVGSVSDIFLKMHVFITVSWCEWCREYLATFKKTVAMHEVFLSRLASHSTLRADPSFKVFLEYEKEVSVVQVDCWLTWIVN